MTQRIALVISWDYCLSLSITSYLLSAVSTGGFITGTKVADMKCYREFLLADLSRVVNVAEFGQSSIGRFRLFWTIIVKDITNRSLRAVHLYRKARFHYVNNNRIRYQIFRGLKYYWSSIEIDVRADIGPGLGIGHAQCIVISGPMKLGKNCLVFQGVTIGGSEGKHIDGRTRAVIGDNVTLFAGSKIIGPVTIGNNVQVGANAVVVDDIPSNATVGGIPAHILNIRTEQTDTSEPRSPTSE